MLFDPSDGEVLTIAAGSTTSQITVNATRAPSPCGPRKRRRRSAPEPNAHVGITCHDRTRVSWKCALARHLQDGLAWNSNSCNQDVQSLNKRVACETGGAPLSERPPCVVCLPYPYATPIEGRAGARHLTARKRKFYRCVLRQSVANGWSHTRILRLISPTLICRLCAMSEFEAGELYDDCADAVIDRSRRYVAAIGAGVGR